MEDDKTVPKTAAIIYGGEKNILKFLDSKEILRDENTDTIVGISAVKYSEVKKFFK